ncbi:hypothetical protein LY76DRAFT_541462 [Colletotrichum caudatum]|nr:hypothetical protein LY76DRAFT_541462 [Colletotrichum caudatum]
MARLFFSFSFFLHVLPRGSNKNRENRTFAKTAGRSSSSRTPHAQMHDQSRWRAVRYITMDSAACITSTACVCRVRVPRAYAPTTKVCALRR